MRGCSGAGGWGWARAFPADTGRRRLPCVAGGACWGGAEAATGERARSRSAHSPRSEPAVYADDEGGAARPLPPSPARPR